MNNLKTVQEIYAAFGRGDIPAILTQLDDSVDWEYGARPSNVPWLQHKKGPAEAKKFFDSLSELEIRSFVPKTFLESPGIVVALCDIDCTVKKTGKAIVEEDEAHIWYFNSAGRVVRFRHRVDTHLQMTAWQG